MKFEIICILLGIFCLMVIARDADRCETSGGTFVRGMLWYKCIPAQRVRP